MCKGGCLQKANPGAMRPDFRILVENKCLDQAALFAYGP